LFVLVFLLLLVLVLDGMRSAVRREKSEVRAFLTFFFLFGYSMLATKEGRKEAQKTQKAGGVLECVRAPSAPRATDRP
jgi:Na+-transporting methylmalonyl-CoA/oxaloacetate decarboxylase gamma subunit